MNNIEKIIEFIDEARQSCLDDLKEIKNKNSVGAGYALGGADELMYLKERIMQEIKINEHE